MGQRGIGQDTSQWYLIARHGDMVMRVRSGMPLGETAAGELSFDASCAQLELDITDDGGLVLSAVDDHELESAGGTRCHSERLARHRRAEIRLPHNVLQLGTDFVEPALADETVEIRAVRPTEHITEPQVARFAEGLLDEPAGDEPAGDEPTGDEPADAPMVPTLSRPPPSWDEQKVDPIAAHRRTARTGARRRRIISPSTAAAIGLAGIGFALLYPVLRESHAPAPSATVDAGTASQTAVAQAPTAVAASTGPGADVLSSTASLPRRRLRLAALDAPRATEPDVLEQVARLPEPGSVAAPAIEPLGRRTVERPAIPQVAQTVGSAGRLTGQEVNDGRRDATTVVGEPQKSETTRVPVAELRRRSAPEPVVPPPVERPPIPQVLQAAERVTEPGTIESANDAIVSSELQESGAATRALDAEVARQRALYAADQALARGELMTPPETNAYVLYNRVLELHPGSPEALGGLRSVRQGLINRALAQLAGNALDDARGSLQAAADAGADPMLVTNLRDEVDYRQRLINARAGQDE